MGLAAFQRMRRVESMKAENIEKKELVKEKELKEKELAKEKAMDLEKANEEATEDYVEVETNDELSIKDKPVRRSKRN